MAEAPAAKRPRAEGPGTESHAESVIASIEKMYREGGMYGELTQLQHGLQCAECARLAGKDDLFIVAALLHDVGWMLAAATADGDVASKETCEDDVGGEIISDRKPSDDCLAAKLGILAQCRVEGANGASADEEQRRAQHDVIGATWLRMQGFEETIPHLVEGHVLAKRYLVAADDTYAAKLSPASTRTLVYQGGKMTAEEMRFFEQDPLHEDCKLLRTFDEAAKVQGRQVPGLEAHTARIRAALVRLPRKADMCFSQTYKREGNTIVGMRALPSENPTVTDVVGWYSLQWTCGEFPVCFRPCGMFFCPKFQAQAKWEMRDDVVHLDWAKFGKYELRFDKAAKSMEGYAVPENKEDDKNWRKAKFVRDLSPVERVLIGDGAGSEWDFEWSGGSFPVQFKADGYNHFKCQDFPAHAHWSLDGDKLRIAWGEYGNYDLEVDAASRTMSGCAVGGNPETDWRKAKLLRNIVSQQTLEACEHHH